MRSTVLLLLTVLLGMPVLQAAEACCIALPAEQLQASAAESESEAVPPCHGGQTEVPSSNTNLPHADCSMGASCMSGVMASAAVLPWLPDVGPIATVRPTLALPTRKGVTFDLIRPPSLI